MADHARIFIRVDAHVSRLAALVPVAVALERWGEGAWHDIGKVAFVVLWLAIVAIVVAEVVVMFRLGENRTRAVLWLGAVALANPAADPIVQVLLTARVARAVRLRKEFAEEVGRQVFSGRGIRFVVAISILGMFGLGWLFSAVETTQHLSVGDGVWFALVTAATVGYGDIVPSDTAGRFIASALMILGLVVVGLLTGAIAERFTRATRPEENVTQRLDELAERLERIETSLGGTGGRT
jgi:voltage-gated potassium channel Kch